VNAISPTASPLADALIASSAATSAATVRLVTRRLPRAVLPEMSTMQQERSLTLFDVPLDVRPTSPRGDVPVDAANIVAGLVFADFLEGQARALVNTMVRAAEFIGDRAASGQLQATDLGDDFSG
jgi:hypothetical protein